jgi:hypothetical protein
MIVFPLRPIDCQSLYATPLSAVNLRFSTIQAIGTALYSWFSENIDAPLDRESLGFFGPFG